MAHLLACFVKMAHLSTDSHTCVVCACVRVCMFDVAECYEGTSFSMLCQDGTSLDR